MFAVSAANGRRLVCLFVLITNYKPVPWFGGNWLVGFSCLGLLAPGFRLQNQG